MFEEYTKNKKTVIKGNGSKTLYGQSLFPFKCFTIVRLNYKLIKLISILKSFFFGQLTDWLSDWLASSLINRQIDWLADRLANWLTGWLVDWQAGYLWTSSWTTPWWRFWQLFIAQEAAEDNLLVAYGFAIITDSKDYTLTWGSNSKKPLLDLYV